MIVDEPRLCLDRSPHGATTVAGTRRRLNQIIPLFPTPCVDRRRLDRLMILTFPKLQAFCLSPKATTPQRPQRIFSRSRS